MSRRAGLAGWAILGIAVAPAVGPPSARADGPAAIAAVPEETDAAPRWAASAGAVASLGPEYAGASRVGARLQPGLALRYGRISLASRSAFAVRGADGSTRGGLAVELVRSSRWRSSLGLRWDSGRDQDSSPELAGLGDVRGTLRARVSLGLRLDRGWRLGAAWNADALGRGLGWLADMNLGRDWSVSPSTGLGAALSLGFADARWLRSWYGITPEQAAATGYAPYAPGGGLRELGFTLGGRTQLDRRWALFYGATASRLLGPAAASPLAREPTGFGFSVGLVARLF